MPAPTKASCPHGSRLPCLAAHAVTSPPAAWEQIMAGSWAVQDAQVGQPPSPGTGDCRAQGQETTRLALVQNPWKSMCDVFIRCTFHEPFEDARVDLSNFFGTKIFLFSLPWSLSHALLFALGGPEAPRSWRWIVVQQVGPRLQCQHPASWLGYSPVQQRMVQVLGGPGGSSCLQPGPAIWSEPADGKISVCDSFK